MHALWAFFDVSSHISSPTEYISSPKSFFGDFCFIMADEGRSEKYVNGKQKRKTEVRYVALRGLPVLKGVPIPP